MLKRQRASSPPSYEDDDDFPHRSKRGRLTGPNDSPPSPLPTWRFPDDDEEAFDMFEDVVQIDGELLEEVDDTEPSPPPSLSSSSYTSINTLLRDLNRTRLQNSHSRPQGPETPTKKTIVTRYPSPIRLPTPPDDVDGRPPSRPQTHPGLMALGQVKTTKARYSSSPAVSSPLRQSTKSPEVVDNVPGGSGWESEAVKARYEETNRCVNSYVPARSTSYTSDGLRLPAFLGL